jgi:hypothetical protein
MGCILSGLKIIDRTARYMFAKGIESRAWSRGMRFYCSALAGESSYNICINSDMTVSCNCHDPDGTGIIGDFSVSSMKEIFDGQRAQSFRTCLAKGHLPILRCAFCPELKSISADEAEVRRESYTLPHKGLMVETNVTCNLHCRSCDRTVQKLRGKKFMNLGDIRRVAGFLRENNVQRVVLHNLGEPFLSPLIGQAFNIFREGNPELFMRLSTNMLLIDNDEKREAAMLLNHITVSLDGVNTPMVVKYQRGGNFDKAYGNMCDLVAFRNRREKKEPLISWQYLLFNWNDNPTTIRKARAQAQASGVDEIRFTPTHSPWYGTSWRYLLGGYCRRVGISVKPEVTL